MTRDDWILFGAFLFVLTFVAAWIFVGLTNV